MYIFRAYDAKPVDISKVLSVVPITRLSLICPMDDSNETGWGLASCIGAKHRDAWICRVGASLHIVRGSGRMLERE